MRRLLVAPILAIYAEPPTYPFLPIDAPPELPAKAQAFYAKTIIPWTKESIRELRESRPDAKIIEMRDALHHVFITNPSRTAELMERFMSR